MSTKAPINVFVTVVPPWLSALVKDGLVSIKDLLDYKSLCDILSVDDVSFYHAYTTKLTPLTNGAFSDLRVVSQLPANADWVANHNEAVETALDNLDITHFMEAAPVDANPKEVYRTILTPYHYDRYGLVLLSEFGVPTPTDDQTFYNNAMSALERLVGYQAAIQCKVLDTFIASAQKNWRMINL